MRTILFALFLGVSSQAASQPMQHFSFPEKIDEFARMKVTNGHKMHASDKDTLHYMNSQATYRLHNDTLLIYLSRFASAAEASSMLQTMQKNINAGKGGYTGLKEETVAGKKVSAAASPGKAHYFFQTGRDIFWLAAPPEYCQKLLETFMQGLTRPLPGPGSEDSF